MSDAITPSVLDEALIQSELMDCRAQRDQCQKALTQAQQTAQTAANNIVRLDGAEAVYLTLLEKIKP